MKAEIITIGDELLIGQTIDTNSAWMAVELNKIGVEVTQITSISDRKEHIINTLKKTVGKSDLIFLTGGLGPTSDDITKPALCEFFNSKLVFNNEVLLEIERLFKHLNIRINEYNRRQAEVPDNCTVFINKRGTAPGMRFEKDGTIVFSMAGVPYEMKHIMSEYILPEISGYKQEYSIYHRNIMLCGISESLLSEMLKPFEYELPESIKLAYLPSLGIIKLRLTSRGNNPDEVVKRIDHYINKLYQAVPEYIYAEGEISLEETIGTLLIKKNMTVCTAESCTGGNIARLITSIPGSSDYFKGAIVAYCNTVKTEIIGVQQDTINKYGAVSEQTAIEMALGARLRLETDFSVAVTGIAGPTGGSNEKPVGTVCIAVSSTNGTSAKKVMFGHDRNLNIIRFSIAALDMLRRQIISE